MRVWTVIFAFSITLMFSWLIGPSLADSPPGFAERYKKAKAECLDRDWSQTECKIWSNKVFKYEKRNLVEATLAQMGGGVLDAYKCTRDFMKKYAVPAITCGYPGVIVRAEELIFDQLLSDLKQTAKKGNLSECHRACLATCMSSRMLTYDDSTRFDSVRGGAAVLNGTGLCTHFSQLADEFMAAVNIPSKLVYGIGSHGEAHAAIGGEIGGEEYWKEPQNTDCHLIKFDP